MECIQFISAAFKFHPFKNKAKVFGQIIFIILICSFSLNVEAQLLSYRQWFKGEIYLKDGASYQGDLKYDFRYNIVYYKKDNLQLIFHAGNILNFYIYKEPGIYYQFKSHPYKKKKGRKIFMIFQIAYSGDDYEILVRENYLGTSDFSYVPLPTGTALDNKKGFIYKYGSGIIIENKYFIQPRYGAITEVKLSRRKVLKAFPENSNKLKDYIVGNRLYFKKFGDLIKVAEYYDRIIN